MRFSGRSACGRIPESTIATEKPPREGSTPRDSSDRGPRQVARAGCLIAETETPASRETCWRAEFAAERRGAAEHYQGRTRLRISNPYGGATIEQAVERGVAFGGRRELHDHARAMAGRDNAAHGLVGAGAAHGTTAIALKTSDTTVVGHHGRFCCIKDPGAGSTSPRECKKVVQTCTKSEPGYLTPAQSGRASFTLLHERWV